MENKENNLVAPTEDNSKLFVFKIQEENGGVQVDFNTVDPEGNPAEDSITTVDLSLIVITLVRLLKDQGLGNDELKAFMNNIVDETDNADIVGEENETQEEQEQEQE